MASDGPEFLDEPKRPAPAGEAPARPRGCLVYGCLIAISLSMLITILLGIGLYTGYRALDRFIQDYTTTTRKELPKLEMGQEEREAVIERVGSFHNAIDKGKPAEPLVLDSDEVNALIEGAPEELKRQLENDPEFKDKLENDPELKALIEGIPDFKGKLHVALKGDEIQGQLSLPLTDILDVGFTRGRYLYGEAKLKASLRDGVPIVTVDSLKVNGKEPPDDLMNQLRSQNLAADAFKNPRTAEWLRKIESIEVKDGKLIIKPRSSEKKPATGEGPAGPDHPQAAGAAKPNGREEGAEAGPKAAPSTGAGTEK